MEKIKIGQHMYEIKSIRPTASHVLQIVFVDEVPTAWGDITTYTIGGLEGDTITGYDTVWRKDGQTVYLSNDGSVYNIPPEEPEPSEPYIPTVEEIKETKKSEVAAECERIIYRGINITLSDGLTEHYSLTEHDQLNLFGKQIQVSAGQEQIEYHADNKPCRYYSIADMQTIIQAAMGHVSYHTTYCNALNMWIADCKTVEEAEAIFYGADVPEEYQSDVLKAYLIQLAALAGGDDHGPA